MAVDQIARMMALDAAQSGGGGAVQSDWNQSDDTADDYIKNKPTIPAAVTVDQVYDGTSANPQSGVAINSVIGNINTVLEEVL